MSVDRIDGDSTERPRRSLKGLQRILPFLARYPTQLVGAAIALVVAAASVLVIGQAIRRVVDHGFDGDPALIDQYFLALLAVVTVLAIATFARYYFVTWLGERVVADVRARVYDRVVRLTPAFFETTRTAEVLSRLTADVTLIQTVIGSTASVAMRNLLLFVGGAGLLYVSSPRLTLLVFMVVPVVVVPIVLFGRKVRQLSRESQDRIADVAAHAQESLNAVSIVQAFAREDDDSRRFAGTVEQAFATALRRVRARAWLTALVMLLVFGAVDLVVWRGAVDVAAGDISGGELVAFVFYAIVVAAAVGALAEVFGELQRAAGAAERLMDLLDTPDDLPVPAHPVPLPAVPEGRIELRDVTFAYPSRPGQSALAGFDLAVAPGETVALVGPSGAGKTTVFQLLLRFHAPRRLVHTILNGPAVEMRDGGPGELRAAEDFGPGADADAIARETLAAIGRTLREAEDITVASAQVGQRPMPADGLPIIGFMPQVEGLYIAAMHAAVILAPTVARMMTAELLDDIPVAMLEELRPGRAAA